MAAVSHLGFLKTSYCIRNLHFCCIWGQMHAGYLLKYNILPPKRTAKTRLLTNFGGDASICATCRLDE